VSQDGYFFEGLTILITTFCVCADGFKVLQKLFSNFLFASLKLITNFEMLTETLLRIPFSVIGRCFLVPTPLIGCRENAQEKTCHGRLPFSIFSVKIVVLGSSKRVTGRIYKISK
jgi:hypothetical protein